MAVKQVRLADLPKSELRVIMVSEFSTNSVVVNEVGCFATKNRNRTKYLSHSSKSIFSKT